ncbi:hypothetical protein BDV25DRAFT_150713 [Aspergillus avenaceus]|uniref:Cytidyltransferase-like domain-containing protein n=1 Tax=Aspergillus avenaceus TaxID=36643 RepID=A0A5N6U1V2_ASPAV|nr:hypothetical protein BDV25DRAFT_150713 [Aspergillus avenaceus]
MSSASALLLLPPPPSTTFREFKNTYEQILSTVYTEISQSLNDTTRPVILDIALFLPGLLSPECQPRARVFKSLQSFLANIYRLLGIVSVKTGVELDTPGGIDARVLLLDFGSAQEISKNTLQTGPVLDLQTLATSNRSWDRIFYPDNKVGQQLAAAFSSLHTQFKGPNAANICSIPKVSDWLSSTSLVKSEETSDNTLHRSVCVGGTFDHFHIGHKLLLTATALALDPFHGEHKNEALLTVGVTGDELLVNKKYAEVLESWDERCEATGSFLSAIMVFCSSEDAAYAERVSQPGPNGKYVLMKVQPGLTLKIVQISDPFGPTITDEDVSALVVSQETRTGGAAVNNERAKKGWKTLDIFEIDVLHSREVPSNDVENFASKISSTDIRRHRMEQAKK